MTDDRTADDDGELREECEVSPCPGERVHVEIGAAESPSMAAVRALASVMEREPIEMPPLFEYIDPDAIDAIVSAAPESTAGIRLQFPYEDRTVTVHGHGTIVVSSSHRR